MLPQLIRWWRTSKRGQECSIRESFKVREARDVHVGIIFGCGEDEYCVVDPASSLGGCCIKLHQTQC
jgi:hypothetical protein